MSSRFDATSGTLNLSRFHNDRAFLGQDVYVPLARSSVMNNVIKIINENVPQVRDNDGLLPEKKIILKISFILNFRYIFTKKIHFTIIPTFSGM